MGSLEAALVREGWFLKEDSLAGLLEGLGGGSLQQLGVLESTLKDLDLKEVGAANLPDDVNRAANKHLGGVRVLQVVSIQNVSQPSKVSGGGSGQAPRLLRLRLTDGHITATAIEYQSVPALSPDLPPGTKLVIKDALIMSGVILLSAKNVRVLGGHVPHLADAWEMDRKMKIIAKGGPKQPVDGPRPPPFTGVNVKGRKATAANEKVPSGGQARSESDAQLSQQNGQINNALRGGSVSERGHTVGHAPETARETKRGPSNDWRRQEGLQKMPSNLEQGSSSRPNTSTGQDTRREGSLNSETGSSSANSRQSAESSRSVREGVRIRPGMEPYRPRPRTAAELETGSNKASVRPEASTPVSETVAQRNRDDAHVVVGRSDVERNFGRQAPRETEQSTASRLQQSSSAHQSREQERGASQPAALDQQRPGSKSGVLREEPPGRPDLDTRSLPGDIKADSEVNAKGGVKLPPVAAPVQNKSAAMKLLERRDNESETFRGGRGRGRGRGGRRRRFDDEGDDVGMTLEEWEAKKAAPKVSESDEELARRMQQQFDLEERQSQAGHSEPLSAAEQLRLNMFSFNKPEEPSAFAGGRGRGRGRSSGRGRGGRY